MSRTRALVGLVVLTAVLIAGFVFVFEEPWLWLFAVVPLWLGAAAGIRGARSRSGPGD